MNSADCIAAAAASRQVPGLWARVSRAWRGLWLFTWKSRLTWRALPGLLVTLLAIPLLTYFTIEPMQRLADRAAEQAARRAGQRTGPGAVVRKAAPAEATDSSQARPFYHWLIEFYLLLALPLYCLTTCGPLIRDDLQSDTLVFLLTRPISRAWLFGLKYVCQMLWLEALVAVHGLFLYGAGLARGVPEAASTMAPFFAAQFLAVLAWGALSALLGILTRRYLLLGIGYGFIVEVGIGHIPTNINSLSLTRHLQGLLGHHPILNQLYEWAPQNTGGSVGALLLGAGLFLAAGALIFTFREYHQAAEMQR